METMDNEILQALSARKSVRVYTDEPVTEAERDAILQAAFQAPTAGNQQLYTILNITDPALIEGIHGQYAAAGSRIVNANTFGASAHKLAGSAYTLEQVITAGIENCKRACAPYGALTALDVGPLGAGEDRYHLFRIVGRPYALSAKVLAGLNSTQKRQIVNGIVGSIYTLHHFMPPLPHRGLRPGCYYVCRQGANCRAVLALFSTIKDNTAEKTVYGELNSLLQNVTDRMYIAPELSGGARPGELTKADIYSLGRLIAFVYTGEPRADLDDLRIPCAMVELVQKLTDPDPARRPDIDAVRARLENGGGQRLVYGAAACQGTRPRQEDVLLANGTLTARPDYTLADTAPCPAAFAVLDGIGGGYGGAEVAHAAAEALDRAAAPYLHMELADYTQPLAAIFADAEREMKRFMAENGYTRSGASAALVIAASRAIYTANLGDSRVYRYTHGALTQLTRDHRFALGGRHELYQYLGASDEDAEISPTIGKIDRVAGERLLLCTDGVSGKLSDEELAAMLTAHPDAGDAAGAIIAAVKSVATDNATVLVVDL